MPIARTDRQLFSHLGSRLEAIINFQGIDHKELATVLSCHAPFIAHLCDGRRLLPAHKLQLLSNYLKVTSDQLLGKAPLSRKKSLYLPKVQ